MSQSEAGKLVAKAVGRKRAYHQGTVADWLERGVRDVDVLYAIAAATGVNFAWLATGKGAMLPAPNGEILVDVSSVEAVPDPDAGVQGVEHSPEQPGRLGRRDAGGKHHRPVKKHPPA